jgi:hypothetical protein
MAVDANILLQGRVPDATNALIAGLHAGQQMRQQRQEAPLRHKLLNAQVAGAEQQQQLGQQQLEAGERDSIIRATVPLMDFIQRNDEQGARSWLMSRKQAFQDAGKNTVQTDEALQLLDSGGLKALAGPTQALYREGIMTGRLRDPSADDIYKRRSLDLQELRLLQQQQANAENMAFRQQQSQAQLDNQATLNAIRKQQADTAAASAQATRDAAAQKAEVKATGLDQELISLEGVLADINRAEELLNGNKNLTGPLVGMTPNLSEGAQELESLSQSLGIGALQQFKGATSEKELAAALRSGLSMKSDAAPNLKRLAAQKAVVQRNIDRIRGLRGERAPTPAGNAFKSSSGIEFTVE